MSYNKRVWANGDLITKEKINHMEDGIYDAHDKINAIDNDLSSQIKDITNTKIHQFDSLASMKLCDLKEGQVCETLGYYKINDGGGAQYYIVNDDALLEDNGSVHRLNNGLKAKLIIGSEINIKTFGAKGDGISDDTVAIQNAINFAQNGYKLIIDRGIYSVSNTIQMSKALDIDSYGTIKAIKKMDVLFLIRSKSDTRLSFYTINNLQLNCDGLAETGLLVTDSRGGFFNNITVEAATKIGIEVSISKGYCKDCTGTHFKDITINSKVNPNTKGGFGFIIDNTDSIIDNVTVINYTYGLKCLRFATINNFHPYITWQEILDGSIGYIHEAYSTVFLNSYYDDTMQKGIQVNQVGDLFINDPFMYINPNYYNLIEFSKLPYFIEFTDSIYESNTYIKGGRLSSAIEYGGFLSNCVTGKLSIDNCKIRNLYNVTMNEKQKQIHKNTFNTKEKVKVTTNDLTTINTDNSLAMVKLNSETSPVLVWSIPYKSDLDASYTNLDTTNVTVTKIRYGYNIVCGSLATSDTWERAVRIKIPIDSTIPIYYISFRIENVIGDTTTGGMDVQLSGTWVGYLHSKKGYNKMQIINDVGADEIWLEVRMYSNAEINLTHINISPCDDEEFHEVKITSNSEYEVIPVFKNGYLTTSSSSVNLDVIY